MDGGFFDRVIHTVGKLVHLADGVKPPLNLLGNAVAAVFQQRQIKCLALLGQLGQVVQNPAVSEIMAKMFFSSWEMLAFTDPKIEVPVCGSGRWRVMSWLMSPVLLVRIKPLPDGIDERVDVQRFGQKNIIGLIRYPVLVDGAVSGNKMNRMSGSVSSSFRFRVKPLIPAFSCPAPQCRTGFEPLFPGPGPRSRPHPRPAPQRQSSGQHIDEFGFVIH